jgi:hypothetical protein
MYIVTIEATPEETIAAVKKLRAAGSVPFNCNDNEKEQIQNVMRRKMAAARIIENKRIDEL